MSELRWILIGFGAVLLAGIYLWGRRSGKSGSSEDALVRVRPEPHMQPHEPRGVDAVDGGEAGEEPPFDSPVTAREPPLPAVEPSMITAVRAAYRSPDPAASADSAGHCGSGSYSRDVWRGRVEPTFGGSPGDVPTEELPVNPPEDSPAPEVPSAQAPTLAMSTTPPPKRIERRKIIALRLAAGAQKFDGARMRAALEAEQLQHGKYDVFHRLHHDGTSVFSVASMVEPGTFDLDKMATTQFPGVTMFAQLPGPVPGMHALNELVACARRLQETLGGTLQDERGIPLTVHRVERLRQEVREFERPSGGPASRGSMSPSAGS